MKISCYDRPDGKIGVRNHVVVIPGVLCANEIAGRISGPIKGAVALRHAGGCTCNEDVVRLEGVLAGLGAHPNVAGALVDDLGDAQLLDYKVFERFPRRLLGDRFGHLLRIAVFTP